jgi:hypothetical protein
VGPLELVSKIPPALHSTLVIQTLKDLLKYPLRYRSRGLSIRSPQRSIFVLQHAGSTVKLFLRPVPVALIAQQLLFLG